MNLTSLLKSTKAQLMVIKFNVLLEEIFGLWGEHSRGSESINAFLVGIARKA